MSRQVGDLDFIADVEEEDDDEEDEEEEIEAETVND